MHGFAYASPKAASEAIELLQRDGSAVLAGGTDLLSLLKDSVEEPTLLVDIKRIEDFQGIDSGVEGLRIGATVTLSEMLAEPSITSSYPSLAQAIRGIRSPQIQNMGTVGGDLCQRPRCWYYRSGHGLLAEHDGKSMVTEGDNRYHAIFGDGPARFVAPSSLAPPLIALGAQLEIVGSSGARAVPVEGFFRSPSRAGEREHALGRDEIVTAVRVPAGETRNATYEVRERGSLDWPLATASVSLAMNGGKIERADIVLGHVAPVPWRARSAGEFLTGRAIDQQVAAAAAELAVEPAKPLSHNQYKVQLARVAVKRALLAAA